jgi:hypothetical protein
MIMMSRLFLGSLLMVFGFGCATWGAGGTYSGGAGVAAHMSSTSAPEEAPQQFRISGFSCENGYGADLNQVYVYQGTSADGRPYYRGKTRDDRCIYHDARCGDDTPNPRWLLGGKPDISRTSDLNPNDGTGCENDVGFDSDAPMPVMGTHETSWLWCGDKGSSGQSIMLSAD